MKKLLLLFILVTIIVLLLFWLKEEPSIVQTQNSDQSFQVSESGASTKLQISSEQTSKIDAPLIEHKAPDEAKAEVPSNVCKEQLAKQYPELDQQFHQVIEGFYISGEQMAGEGVYQNMPFESLKPLADGNDPQAMMIYGSDMIWYSATGVRINKTNSQYRTEEQTREIIKSHQIDINGVEQGSKYLYKAAVFGKVGSIFELAILLDFAARKIDREGGDENVTLKFLSISLAHKELIQDIHQHDLSLKGIFAESLDPLSSIQRLYADREDYAEIKKRIETDAESMYRDLKQRWEYDREYYGFELYPDYLQGELEEYGNAYLDCHL